MLQLRKKNWLLLSKKKVKIKFIYWTMLGTTNYFTDLLLSLACWLRLERRLRVYNAGLKVDAGQEILTVIMTSCYKNACSYKRHTVVHHAFCFWRFALLFLGLKTHYHESLCIHFTYYCLFLSLIKNFKGPFKATSFSVTACCITEETCNEIILLRLSFNLKHAITIKSSSTMYN